MIKLKYEIKLKNEKQNEKTNISIKKIKIIFFN